MGSWRKPLHEPPKLLGTLQLYDSKTLRSTGCNGSSWVGGRDAGTGGIAAQETGYISGTSVDGFDNPRLAPDRTPTLYTGDFGDCLGGESLLNITQFDAALYWDNATILMHLDGRTNIRSEDVMLHFSLDAYGDSRYSRVIDPCRSNMTSLCPMRAGQSIGALGVFAVTANQVSAIPQMAFSMPDVEGVARVQIFANSSKTEIACFQASLRNGKTVSQPAAVSSTLAVFTVIAIIASFATAAYGVSMAHMRTHYAHSLSVLVVFETFQSIFLTGALSLRWPAILPAWWSNFSWATGIIPATGIVHGVNSFVGISGNASQVGGAGSTVLNNNGGLTQLIYGRLPLSNIARAGSEILQRRSLDLSPLAVRQSISAAAAYNDAWNGAPVLPGLPLPGDERGFAQTLSILSMPAQSAFVVAVIWTAVAIALVLLCCATLKVSLEGLVVLKWIKQDRLQFYRTQWLGYLAVAVLRTCLIAVFPMATLALYQFATGDGASAVAVAAVVFIIFLAGTCFLVWHALYARFRHGKFALASDRILLRPARLFKVIPFVAPVRLSQLKESEFAKKPRGSLPFLRLHFIDENPSRQSAHEDEPYIKQHGWLSARYRLSRWWFFSCWAAYQVVRACFLGGAAANPLAQVFGLFMVEILAFIILCTLNPYEGQRNTALAVWLLGLAKVITSGMSIAFLPDFYLNRVATTVIGLFIIIVQALLTAAVLILIVLGCISTWMSLYRNREQFVTDKLDDMRIKYYDHIAESAKDEKKPSYEQRRRQKPKSTYMVNTMATGNQSDITPVQIPAPILPHSSRHKTAHSFAVNNVRRLSKIEDEDDEPVDEIKPTYTPTIRNSHRGNRSRTTSMSSMHSTSSLPRGARPHRVSWSSYDFTFHPRAMHNNWRTTATLVRYSLQTRRHPRRQQHRRKIWLRHQRRLRLCQPKRSAPRQAQNRPSHERALRLRDRARSRLRAARQVNRLPDQEGTGGSSISDVWFYFHVTYTFP
ncbi:hypothetical protein Micbo1qcDRAFT_189066 [Microdochium bolleyi]|uniref:ML-like domain-containing protein n=1 Tax=Microdochium bolleyi TaxID=196109 RepID=A0A136J065_9PEZI|nr:hypothetical protein Micbo1qcDRAFT_189066 [Microdochium bolleyi]